MRILSVHNRYRSDVPSGEDRVVDQESSGLLDRGHDVELFQRHSDTIGEWGPARRVALPATALWGASSHRPFLEHLDRFRPDVVHVHNLFPLISPRVLRWCADARVPVVATLHNYNLICAKGSMYRDDHPCSECVDGRLTPAVRHSCYHDSLMHTIPLVTGLKVHRSAWRTLVSAYIAISHAMLEPLAALRLPTSRIFVKPNFVPPVGEPSWQRDPQVAYAGRLEEAKGVRVLQAAWEEFQIEAPGSSLRLSISGGGPLAGEVASWASRQPSVDFHGLLSRDAVMHELARSRCSVMPSLWQETFGLVAVESMALGVAPVAASHGAFPELVTSGTNGLLFDATDVTALASILRRVDQDPSLFQHLGREARKTYETVFHPGPNLDRLLDIYAFAVANPISTSSVHLG